MNAYEIEGTIYQATNEYEAVKQAYKMAERIVWGGYIGNEAWHYIAIYCSGKAEVTVKRVRQRAVLQVAA